MTGPASMAVAAAASGPLRALAASGPPATGDRLADRPGEQHGDRDGDRDGNRRWDRPGDRHGGLLAGLHADLLEAHARHDASRLARLYARAADLAANADASAFFLTHAYVYALDAGCVEGAAYHSRLVALGRDA